MKVTLEIKCGEKGGTMVEAPIGVGDKTFKWLGAFAAQIYARHNPNGSIRCRDNYRGLTTSAQHHAVEVVLGNDEIPHPMSLLQDYVLDGDIVYVNLTDTLSVKEGGVPDMSTFSSLANTNCIDSPLFVDDTPYIEDDNLFEREEDDVDESNLKSPSAQQKQAEQRELKAATNFMSVILDSQMPAVMKVRMELDACWEEVHKLMPKLNARDTQDIKQIFEENFAILDSIFRKFTKEDNFLLSRLKFKEIIAETNMFERESDFETLTMRTFRLVDRKGNLKITFGEFLASLILLAQTRLHNIFGQGGNEQGAAKALGRLLEKFIGPLASRYRLRIRDLLYMSRPMKEIRDMYDQLFALFEKYALKAGADLTVTMPCKYFAELLRDSKLITLAENEDEPDEHIKLSVSIAEDILTMCRAGYIKGRHIIDEEQRKPTDLPPPPEDEYCFPEFVEGLARATFYLLDDTEEIMFEEDHMIDGFRKALVALEDPAPLEETTGRRGRK